MSSKLRDIAEARANARIREKLPVKWQIKDGNARGEGRVVNVSATGMLLETRSPMTPLENCFFGFTTFLKGEKNFIPQDGRLVWAQKLKFSRDRYHLGIEFVRPPADILTRLQKRIHMKVAIWATIKKFQDVIGISLFVIMVALTMYALSQQSLTYRNISQSNDLMLSNAALQSNLTRKYASLYQQNSEMLASANRELDSTKALLVQTETILTRIQSENKSLQQNAAALQPNTELRNRTAALETKSAQLNQEFGSLQNRLALSAAEITSVQEGKSLLASYRKQFKAVKKRIRVLQKEAAFARRQAQMERDRIAVLEGNNGNFMGGFYFSESAPAKAQPTDTPKKIGIDVSFF